MNKIIEILSAITTGLIFIYLGHQYHKEYIIITSIIWISYILFSTQQKRDYWGITTKNIYKAFLLPTQLFMVGLFYIILNAKTTHHTKTAHLIATLFIYPLWGLLQQFLVQSMIIKNLPQLNIILTIIIGGCLFSIIHIHTPFLLLPTFLLGCAWTYCYIKNNNIIPLGIYHGVLATLYFHYILNQNITFYLQ